MDVNPIVKYLNTLKKTGSVRSGEIASLAVYSFLSDMIEHGSDYGLGNDDIRDINEMVRCISKTSCLLFDVREFECIVKDIIDGLLLTSGGTVICTAGGTPIRLMSSK